MGYHQNRFFHLLLFAIFSAASVAQMRSYSVPSAHEISITLYSPTSTTSLPLAKRTSTSTISASATSTNTPPSNGGGGATNGYYFVLVAVLIILVGATICTIYNRKNGRGFPLLAPRMTNNHENAPTSAGSAWARTRYPRRGANGSQVAAWPYYNRRGGTHEEGLNEAGEAPPPYEVGTKPPSIEHIFPHERLGERANFSPAGRSSRDTRRSDTVDTYEMRRPEAVVYPREGRVGY